MGRVVRLPYSDLLPYIFEPPEEPFLLSFETLFGNSNPVELEVGFGKGLFLLNASASHPNVNYLGIEIDGKYFLFTANRIAKRKRTNVRLICGDARSLLPNFIPSDCLQAVHVYFPDPWWKNRHRKRRLFTEEFALQVQRILQPGCPLHLVSDVEDYFAIMTEMLDGKTALKSQPSPNCKEAEHDLDYLTNFERKYRQEGRPIYRAQYIKPTVQ